MQRYFTGLSPQPPLPWFDAVWQSFIQRYEHKHLPHAILLTSGGGIGEVDLAFAMAQFLLCASPQARTSCGKCKSCQLLAADTHPDLVVVTPEEKSDVIKIEAIREVATFVANTAQQGGRKLVVIYPAESLNVNAANALLKNLEEPNGDTVFLLVSQRPAALMATIRSRCNLWPLTAPNHAAAEAWLERNKVVDPQAKLTKANGRPLLVMAWDNNGLFEQADKALGLVAGFATGDNDTAKVAKSLAAFDSVWLLDQWLGWLQKAVCAPEFRQTHGFFVGNDQALFRFYDCLTQRKQQLLRGNNPNTQMLLEELLLRTKAV